MNQEQKYLFDLQGYIVLKNIIPKRVIDNCNKVLDRFEDMAPEDFPPPLVLGTTKTEKELYISNILESDLAFVSLIDVPEVLSVIQEVTGGPYRLNHTYTIYRWGGGYTSLHMHGMPIISKCQYHCRNGQMVSTLTKAVFPMLDCTGKMVVSPSFQVRTKVISLNHGGVTLKKIRLWFQSPLKLEMRSSLLKLLHMVPLLTSLIVLAVPFSIATALDICPIGVDKDCNLVQE